ncbi:MBL fold metallo-hydrolase [Oleispirillum naphthae]|uniref:MBL fold metallo-hydrolase n=1 Tax=Oleispirillum naphthae TaxID=2838853 RepID=UPI003082679E
MKITPLFQGFPGKMTTGYLGWSSVVLFEQDGRKVLFDTGGIDKRVDLCRDLHAVGVSEDEIDILVVSHFHVDHVYNFDYFRNAEILLHVNEIAYAEEGKDPWQPSYMLDAIKRTGRLRGIEDGSMVIPGLTALHLPGHTPGCIGLAAQADDGTLTVATGDAVKTLAEMATGRAPMTIDAEATLKSVKRVRALASTVIPGHDRMLRIERDRVVAVSPTTRTIVIPAGVADPEQPRTIELRLEPTSLPFGFG